MCTPQACFSPSAQGSCIFNVVFYTRQELNKAGKLRLVSNDICVISKDEDHLPGTHFTLKEVRCGLGSSAPEGTLVADMRGSPTHQGLWHLGNKTRSVLPGLLTLALLSPQSEATSSARGWSGPDAVVYT